MSSERSDTRSAYWTHRTGGLISGLLFIFALCFSAGAAETGDALVTGSIGEPRNLISILVSDSGSSQVTGLVYSGLVRYDKDLELEGELARSWEILDEGRTILFHLRKDVRWHDGEPFTAEDVLFTYQSLMDPKVPTPHRSDYELVESVEIVDAHTLRVKYSEPFAPALSSWGMGVLPAHLLKGKDLVKSGENRNPVGTGPFRFLNWDTGSRVDLVANEDYFEGRPNINRYVIRIIPDQTTLFLELRTQNVDEINLTPLQYQRMTDTEFFKENFRRFRYPARGYTYMGYQLENPLFQDVRVRQALDHAVDKQEIIDGVLFGLGQPCTGPFIPGSWATNAQTIPRPYNPLQAKSILATCGWTDSDGDGWLDKNGKVFEFTLMTNQGNEQRKLAAEIIQRRLAEVGVRVKIKIVEWATFVHEFVDKGRFDAVLLGWGLSVDPDNYAIWHSSQIGEGKYNFVSYHNAEVDELLVKGRTTFDQEARAACYRRIHEIIHEEQPYMFLFVGDALPIVHARFQGIEPTIAGIGYNLKDWYVPKSQQRYLRY
ncbi:MAG: peptide-binding protein [Candidatus Omnitrophica bacterium]|nr:peptide-binding protein [Candidatus Omnitrophota bacterium]